MLIKLVGYYENVWRFNHITIMLHISFISYLSLWFMGYDLKKIYFEFIL